MEAAGGQPRAASARLRRSVRHIVHAGVAHRVERALAVAGLEVDRGDDVAQDGRLEAEPQRVERGGVDAVVRREAAHDDRARRRRSRRMPSSSVGFVSPVTGSRIVKPGVAVLAVGALADPRRVVGRRQAGMELRAPRVGDAVDRPDAAVLRRSAGVDGGCQSWVRTTRRAGLVAAVDLAVDRPARSPSPPLDRQAALSGRRSRSGRRRRRARVRASVVALWFLHAPTLPQVAILAADISLDRTGVSESSADA